jgi:hypothetical protein
MHSSVVVWGTSLYATSHKVMCSISNQIIGSIWNYLILPDTELPWSRPSLYQKWVSGFSLEANLCWLVRLTTTPPLVRRLPWHLPKLWASDRRVILSNDMVWKCTIKTRQIWLCAQLVKQCAMKSYGGGEGLTPLFLTSTLDGTELLATLICPSTFERRVPFDFLTEDEIGPRFDLDAVLGIEGRPFRASIQPLGYTP